MEDKAPGSPSSDRKASARDALVAALAEGEASGFSEPLDGKTLLRRMREKHRRS